EADSDNMNVMSLEAPKNAEENRKSKIENRRSRVERSGLRIETIVGKWSMVDGRGPEVESSNTVRSSIFNLRLSIFLRVLFFVFCLAIPGFNLSAQRPAHLAVLDIAGDAQGEIAGLLRSLGQAPGSERLESLDEDLMRLAARGAGYDGSLNLS